MNFDAVPVVIVAADDHRTEELAGVGRVGRAKVALADERRSRRKVPRPGEGSAIERGHPVQHACCLWATGPFVVAAGINRREPL